LLALAMAAWGFFMGNQLKKSYPFDHSFQDGIDSPVLALELADDSADVNCVLHRTAPDLTHPRCADLDRTKTQTAIKTLQTNTYEDFLFIPLYTLFLWAFAALFAVREDGKRMPHLWVMAVLAVLTAGFDCWENRRIFHVLDSS